MEKLNAAISTTPQATRDTLRTQAREAWAIEIPIALNVPRFENAWRRVIAHNEILRTVVAYRQPPQGTEFSVLPEVPWQFDQEDLGGRTDPEGAFRRWVAKRARRPLQPDVRGFDAALLRLSNRRSVFFINRAGYMADRLPVEDLMHQLAQAYETGNLPTPHRARLATARAWKDVRREPGLLYGVPTESMSAQMARQFMWLGPERTRQIDAMGVVDDVWMTVLCAFIHRVGPQGSVALGRAAVQGAWYAVAVDVVEDETFATLRRKLQGSYPALPSFGAPVGAFDAALIALPDLGTFGGRRLDGHRLSTGLDVAPVALYTRAEETVRGRAIELELNADLLTDRQRSDALGHLVRLLDAFLANPDTPIHEVALLSEKERHHQMVDLNDTVRNWPHVTLPDLLEEAIRPQAPAVTFEDETLTYAVLHARANHLAHRLQDLGVGPNRMVGICLPRSADMVVALLAVMKAGGTYLPMDPGFPRDRLAYMVVDSNTKVVIGSAASRDTARFAAPHAVHVSIEEARDAGDEPPPRTLSPDDLAYVLYTSGSTGRPKGVPITHRALVNYLLSTREILGFTESDTWLAITTLSFDIAGLELYTPLITGARLVVGQSRLGLDGRELTRAIDAEHPTWLQATPATWKLLIDSGWNGTPDLNLVSGGEKLSRELANQLLLRGRSLWNLYGPTETTIYSTMCQVEGGDDPIHVGRPIANTRIYILDEQRRLVPMGVTGELCIGGVGLSPGYLNRDDLTRDRFIRPFRQEPSNRVYRTGDVARYRPDGTIEVLGRLDDQLKLNGYRIEPGEIEAVLNLHAAIRQAVVVPVRFAADDVRLVAFYIPRGETEPSVRDLREHVGAALPPYMIPSRFVRVDRFPLTPNGKLDRRSLATVPIEQPEPGVEAHSAAQVPETGGDEADQLEARLAGMFANLLQVSVVSRNDNFFELGGTSLLAVKLLAEVERVFNRELPLHTVFQAPTVAELAALLQEDKAIEVLVPLKPTGTRAPFFCVHSLIGDVGRDLARHVAPDQPFYGLQPVGLEGQPPLRRVEAMAAHYLARMKAVQPQGPYYVGGYDFGAVVAYEIAQQLTAAGDKVALLAIIDYRLDNIPRHTLRARLRRFINVPLVAMGRSYELFLRKPPLVALELLRRKAVVWLSGTGVARISPEDVAESVRAVFPQWPEHYQRVGQANLEAKLAYVPRPYAGRIHLIRRSEPWCAWGWQDPAWEWGELARHGVTVHIVPGAQCQIMQEPFVQVTAQRLESILQLVQQAV